MADQATPRIDARHLQHFADNEDIPAVRIVGKVAVIGGEVISLEAEGSVVVHINKVSQACSFLQTSRLGAPSWRPALPDSFVEYASC